MYIVNSLTVLEMIYPKNEIFVTRAEATDNPSIVVTCLVPATDYYAVKPVFYVTAENYLRCLSQASYLLAEHILRHQMVDVDTSVETFLAAAENHELYYRHLAMTFHARVGKDEVFVLKLAIKNAREIKRLGRDFILFTFTNEKTVISGEMSFVYANQ